jgi:O-acetyl-ADP-ribose deacetylase (regulator of RNase III)
MIAFSRARLATISDTRTMKNRSYQFGKSRLTIEFGDITSSDAQVMVSSDDYYITMGGGVSASILRAGGQEIMIDASKKVPAKLGEVIVTTAGRLQAQYIFHAITIEQHADRGGSAKDIVRNSVSRCFDLLDALGLDSIAFPAIGAGCREVFLRGCGCRDGGCRRRKAGANRPTN